LSQLNTGDGRAYAVYRLVGKFDVPEQYVREAIDFLEKSENFNAAINIAQRAGLTDKLIDLYEKTGDFFSAAYVAKNAGLTERAIDNYDMKKQDVLVWLLLLNLLRKLS